MNRTSSRETRVVTLEAQMREVLQRLDVLSTEVRQMRQAQGHTVRSILKLSRELEAQRERYPLER